MTASTGSKLILLGFLLLAAIMLIVVLGPLGLLLVPLALIVIGFVLLMTDSDDGIPERVNCADCGAPSPADADVCDYCGAPL